MGFITFNHVQDDSDVHSHQNSVQQSDLVNQIGKGGTPYCNTPLYQWLSLKFIKLLQKFEE
jgi:hypothetical protein